MALSDAADRVVIWLADCHADGHLAARALIGHALADLGLPHDPLRLGAEPEGRPVLLGRGAPHLAISHTAGLVAVAMSGLAPVGVDVEALRPVPVTAMARRWFTAGEVEWLDARPAGERDHAFLWLWTQKEAMGKALGRGLRGAGTRREVPSYRTRPPSSPGRRLDFLAAEVCVTDVAAPAGYVLAVAAGAAAAHAAVEVRRVALPPPYGA
jgi:4'-phosphopantetheinyl transferase